MGLQFRKSASIPDYVYESLRLPKTLEQCEYLINQANLDIEVLDHGREAFTSRINFLSNLSLTEDLEESEETLSQLRKVINVQRTTKNKLTLLRWWKKDFIETEIRLHEKRRSLVKRVEDLEKLSTRIHEVESDNGRMQTSLKQLAAQVSQIILRILEEKYKIEKKQELWFVRDMKEIRNSLKQIEGKKDKDDLFADFVDPIIERLRSSLGND